MFNLFPSFQKPEWLTATGYTIEGKYYSPAELMNEFVKLRDQLRSIEEDGTDKHNNAIKLRQENAQLKVEIDNWKVCSVKWRELYDEKADTVDEQTAEIKKLKKDIIDYVYEKDEQKHPMYPLHWGGYEPEKWSTTKVAMEDAVAGKIKEVYSNVDLVRNQGEEKSGLEIRVEKLEEQLKYIQKITFKE
jgi:hypothetical protein